MKSFNDVSIGMLEGFFNIKHKTCTHITKINGPEPLLEPINASTHQCEYCDSKNHYTVFVDPKISQEITWLCANGDCRLYKERSTVKATSPLPNVQRAIEWPLFCEKNAIGNLHHDIKFEDVHQDKRKIDYLRKFSDNPLGIIFMQGAPGTGKTFASMAVCELFTRRDSGCIFNTQKQMFFKWLETFKSEVVTNYIDRVMTCSLLVIDDFGTSEVSPAFMSFFMDLINSRMQWKNRGTIITTNLDDLQFSNYCGQALGDRINTGIKFFFDGKSRRKQLKVESKK